MRTPLSLLSLGALAAMAACGAKDAPKTDSAKVAQAGASSAAASRGTFDPATHTVTIYAKDYAFEAPDSMSAGMTNFHLVNEGKTLHHVQLVRLDSGKTAADFGAAMKNPGPPPAWATFITGPNAPNPGASFDATFDVKEGNYVIICLVDIPDHTPHFAKGMVAPLKVVAASGTPITAPVADVSLSLADYAFTVTGPLTAGKHTLKIENKGPQLHEVEIVRFAPGKTLKDLGAWMEKPEGPPPADAIGGVSATAIGEPAYATIDFTPGHYAMLCFIPDAKDGKPHLQHGMVKDFEVK